MSSYLTPIDRASAAAAKAFKTLCGTVGVISTNSAISLAWFGEAENARSIKRFSTTPSSPEFGVSSENHIIASLEVRRDNSGSDLFNIILLECFSSFSFAWA